MNEVHNPFLGDIDKSLATLNPKAIYMGLLSPRSSSADANDPNLVFSCELPLATSNNSFTNKTKEKDNDTHIVRTRVILNPPNHSKIATEFVLIPGFLNKEDIARFHRPSFPNRQIDMTVRVIESNEP